MILNRLFILPMFLLTSVLAYAQSGDKPKTDSTYIQALDYKYGIRGYVGQKLLRMTYSDKDDNEREFTPNAPLNFGVGFSIYNTVISFDMGYNIRMRSKQRFGKTKSVDLQVHHYNRKFVVDLYFQQYTGFYEELGNQIKIYPDMRVDKYSIQGCYVLNHRKFSYKATFAQTEKQLKSAGSWLFGVQFNKTKIRSDEPLTSEGYKNSDNFQAGVNAGYVHSWVLGSKWNIALATTVGIALGNEAFNDSGSSSVKVYPTIYPRFSATYDRDSWALDISYAGNMTFLNGGKQDHLAVLSGISRLSFIKRFGKKQGSR